MELLKCFLEEEFVCAFPKRVFVRSYHLLNYCLLESNEDANIKSIWVIILHSQKQY